MREGERGLKERLFVVWPAGGRRPQLWEGGHCLTDFRNVLYSTPRLVGGGDGKKEAKKRERVVVAVAAIAASRRSGALSESSAGTNTTAIQLQNDRAVITGCCN